MIEITLRIGTVFVDKIVDENLGGTKYQQWESTSKFYNYVLNYSSHKMISMIVVDLWIRMFEVKPARRILYTHVIYSAYVGRSDFCINMWTRLVTGPVTVCIFLTRCAGTFSSTDRQQHISVVAICWIVGIFSNSLPRIFFLRIAPAEIKPKYDIVCI